RDGFKSPSPSASGSGSRSSPPSGSDAREEAAEGAAEPASAQRLDQRAPRGLLPRLGQPIAREEIGVVLVHPHAVTQSSRSITTTSTQRPSTRPCSRYTPTRVNPSRV